MKRKVLKKGKEKRRTHREAMMISFQRAVENGVNGILLGRRIYCVGLMMIPSFFFIILYMQTLVSHEITKWGGGLRGPMTNVWVHIYLK